MKIKILTTEHHRQLILTPENEYEKGICELFKDLPNSYRGEFDKCKTGYYRDFGYDKDLIIIFDNSKDNKNNQ